MRLLYKNQSDITHVGSVSSAYAEGTRLMCSTEDMDSDTYYEIELDSEQAVEDALVSLAKNGYFDARECKKVLVEEY